MRFTALLLLLSTIGTDALEYAQFKSTAIESTVRETLISKYEKDYLRYENTSILSTDLDLVRTVSVRLSHPDEDIGDLNKLSNLQSIHLEIGFDGDFNLPAGLPEVRYLHIQANGVNNQLDINASYPELKELVLPTSFKSIHIASEMVPNLLALGITGNTRLLEKISNNSRFEDITISGELSNLKSIYLNSTGREKNYSGLFEKLPNLESLYIGGDIQVYLSSFSEVEIDLSGLKFIKRIGIHRENVSVIFPEDGQRLEVLELSPIHRDKLIFDESYKQLRVVKLRDCEIGEMRISSAMDLEELSIVGGNVKKLSCYVADAMELSAVGEAHIMPKMQLELETGIIRLSGFGQNYELQKSDDLVDWHPVMDTRGMNQPLNQSFSTSQSIHSDGSMMFYRLVSLKE